MRHVVVGMLTDEMGAAYSPGRLHTRAWASPAASYRSTLPNPLRVDREHDHRWVGHAVRVERHHGNLWCVAEVDADPSVPVRVGDQVVKVPSPLYFSTEVARTHDGSDVQLRAVSITRSPATIGNRGRPLLFLPGDLSDRGTWQVNGRNLDGYIRELIERAAESRFNRSAASVIHDTDTAYAGILPRSAPSARVGADPRPATGWVGPDGRPSAGPTRGVTGRILAVR